MDILPKTKEERPNGWSWGLVEILCQLLVYSVTWKHPQLRMRMRERERLLGRFRDDEHRALSLAPGMEMCSV